jgi:hypothetical protein
MLNLIVRGIRQTRQSQHVPQEADVVCENVAVRCGPYDNSDLIEIKRTDEGEIQVLYHSDKNGSENPECVLSVIEEQP